MLLKHVNKSILVSLVITNLKKFDQFSIKSCLTYREDTEPLYHSFMYSLVSLLSGIYPIPAIPAMHSLLVTLYDDMHVPAKG